MASPLRDMSLQMVVEETICPVQKKEHLTIKKKYSIVLACKWSAQGINEYVQTHNHAVAEDGTLITAWGLAECLFAEPKQSWQL